VLLQSLGPEMRDGMGALLDGGDYDALLGLALRTAEVYLGTLSPGPRSLLVIDVDDTALSSGHR
jgi:hypothetical protein